MHPVHRPGESPPPAEGLGPRLLHALALLLEAHDRAADTDCSAWEFAVEVTHLINGGTTATDLRWLCRKGFIEAGRERTSPTAKFRHFQRLRNLSLPLDACVVLTEAGVAFARGAITKAAPPAGDPTGTRGGDQTPRGPDLVPTWDRGLRELRLGARVVKCFRQPAPNQVLILEVFEESGWPPHIDDPLPRVPGLNPKLRLRDTIAALNRHQVNHLIRFHGDGSGEGVGWECLRQSVNRASTEVL
ncbi:MAG TPA: hypothetical protein VIL46_04365 [Gemmataceae bacterium]